MQTAARGAGAATDPPGFHVGSCCKVSRLLAVVLTLDPIALPPPDGSQQVKPSCFPFSMSCLHDDEVIEPDICLQ